MATVLEIAQDAADVIGVERPESLRNNTDPDARTLLRQVTSVGRDLAIMKNSFGQGWAVLQLEHVFETVADQAEYALPGGFERLVDGTVWNRDSYREARGNLTAAEWQLVRSSLIETLSISPFYRMRRASDGMGLAFFLDPTPSSAETLVFEYVSKHWVRSSDGGETRDRFMEDTDAPLFDEELMQLGLVFEFRQSRGLSFATELAKFERRRDRLFSHDTGSRVLRVGRNKNRYRGINIPETIPTV